MTDLPLLFHLSTTIILQSTTASLAHYFYTIYIIYILQHYLYIYKISSKKDTLCLRKEEDLRQEEMPSVTYLPLLFHLSTTIILQSTTTTTASLTYYFYTSIQYIHYNTTSIHLYNIVEERYAVLEKREEDLRQDAKRDGPTTSSTSIEEDQTVSTKSKGDGVQVSCHCVLLLQIRRDVGYDLSSFSLSLSLSLKI